jgi:hypothetical protein
VSAVRTAEWSGGVSWIGISVLRAGCVGAATGRPWRRDRDFFLPSIRLGAKESTDGEVSEAEGGSGSSSSSAGSIFGRGRSGFAEEASTISHVSTDSCDDDARAIPCGSRDGDSFVLPLANVLARRCATPLLGVRGEDGVRGFGLAGDAGDFGGIRSARLNNEGEDGNAEDGDIDLADDGIAEDGDVDLADDGIAEDGDVDLADDGEPERSIIDFLNFRGCGRRCECDGDGVSRGGVTEMATCRAADAPLGPVVPADVGDGSSSRTEGSEYCEVGRESRRVDVVSPRREPSKSSWEATEIASAVSASGGVSRGEVRVTFPEFAFRLSACGRLEKLEGGEGEAVAERRSRRLLQARHRDVVCCEVLLLAEVAVTSMEGR